MLGTPSPLNPPILRDDLPRYPPPIQLIRVTAATVAGPAGVAQLAGSSFLGPTLYVAFTQQLRTDALLPRDREPCLADDVNGAGLTPGFYLGRLAGSYTSLPVYEVITGAAGPMGPSGGTLTIQRSDGSQTVTNVSTLQFDPPDNWTISQVSPGVARVTTRGLTGTFRLCEIDGTTHTYVFVAGLVRSRDGQMT